MKNKLYNFSRHCMELLLFFATAICLVVPVYYMSIVLFDLDLDGSTTLFNINPATFIWDAAYSR